MRSDMTKETLLEGIVQIYNHLVQGIDERARESNDRAYGGVIRASKGRLVEAIATLLVQAAWIDLGEPVDALTFEHHTIKIPLRKGYLARIKDQRVREYVKANIAEMHYRIKPDVQVYVNGEFRLSIECKAYTENAMLKRILVDCTLIKHQYPNVHFVLLQLESQLGGDYSRVLQDVHYGSPATHTLLSYFDIDLDIITLLEGERKVDQPIHRKEFFKPLKSESLEKAVSTLKKLLAN